MDIRRIGIILIICLSFIGCESEVSVEKSSVEVVIEEKLSLKDRLQELRDEDYSMKEILNILKSEGYDISKLKKRD